MVNINMTHEFKHPKYYTELRKRNKSDQAISLKAHDGERERAPDPGLKLPGPRPISNANKGLIHKRQAPSTKPQASSAKLRKHQATSLKPQAASVKLEAASSKLLDHGPWKKFHAPLIKGLYQDK